jgi:excisionase family DNA binding protein
VNLEGPADIVKRMLSGMVAALNEGESPTTTYLSVQEVAQRTGLSPDRLRAMVKEGRLTNYNTAGRILLNPDEVRRVAPHQQDRDLS